MVNLAVDLRAPHFDDAALSRALQAIERAGFSVERELRGGDPFLSWIDDEFGGAWSSEAFAGSNVIARSGSRCAGFASYDAKGMQYSWLRGLGAEDGVGIFGPFGVAREFRKSGVGPHLLVAALASLRERGYARALIPAVGAEKLVAYYTSHGHARVVERFEKSAWRERRFRATVLVSGGGTNLQAVLDASREGRIPVDVTAVVSNVADAYALERARAANVAQVEALPWNRASQTREAYDTALFETVRRTQPELVLLLGWMHLLPPWFVDALPEMLNIHPAFLPLDPAADTVGFPDGSVTPAFRGARAVRDALRFGARWTGASVHRVTRETDRGEVLQRKPLAIADGATEGEVMESLHPLEHRVLTGAIMRWVYER